MSKSFNWLKAKTKLLFAVTVAAILGGVSTAVVMAAIPDAAGIIHGCYRSSGNGTLRVVDSSASCSGNETSITWNNASSGHFLTNLSGADLSGANLIYRDFIDADLHNAIFTDAQLNGSKFQGANLSGTTFSHTLSAKNVDFTNSNLNNATFDFNGSGIALPGSTFSGATFNNAAFTGSMGDSSITGSGGNFQGANFTNVKLGTTSSNGVVFINANLQAIDFRSAQLIAFSAGRSNLANTNFSGMNIGTPTQLNESNLSNANFSNTHLTGVYLNFDTVTGANFTNAVFSGADLQQTNFTGATLTGATWSNTMCPDSTNSDDNGNTCIGHLVP